MVAKNKRNKKSSIKNIFGYFVFFTLTIFLIVFFVVTNWKIYQRRASLAPKVEQLRAEVEALEKIKIELEKESSNIGTEDHLERVAREQFDMKKPGEEVYVVQEEPASTEGSGEAKEKMSWWEKIKSLWGN